MLVSDLKELLKNVDDSATVVVEGQDHSYLKADAFVTTAIKFRSYWYQDMGGPCSVEDGHTRQNILLISAD